MEYTKEGMAKTIVGILASGYNTALNDSHLWTARYYTDEEEDSGVWSAGVRITTRMVAPWENHMIRYLVGIRLYDMVGPPNPVDIHPSATATLFIDKVAIQRPPHLSDRDNVTTTVATSELIRRIADDLDLEDVARRVGGACRSVTNYLTHKCTDTTRKRRTNVYHHSFSEDNSYRHHSFEQAMWEGDRLGYLAALAKDTVVQMFSESVELEEGDRRKSYSRVPDRWAGLQEQLVELAPEVLSLKSKYGS